MKFCVLLVQLKITIAQCGNYFKAGQQGDEGKSFWPELNFRGKLC